MVLGHGTTLDTYHLDLHHSFVAIVKQITRLSLVDTNDTQQKLAAQAQGHGSLVRRDDGLNAVGDA